MANQPELTTRCADLSARIQAAGVRTPSVADKAALLARVLGALEAEGVGAGEPVAAYWVPGRIEVLGKHTDYVGGRSLLAATERGFWFAVAPVADGSVTVSSLDMGERAVFGLSPGLSPAVGHWSNYPMTVARRLARNFEAATTGAVVAFGSDLPQASGMSSSSALIVGFYMALAGVNGLSGTDEFRANIHNTEELAGYLGTIENGQSYDGLAGDKGVGTFGGSEDHTAILACSTDQLSQYAYCPVRFERKVPVPEGYTFAIGMSGVVAEKTGSAMAKYNRASQLAGSAAEAWRRASGSQAPNLADAVAESGGSPDPIRSALAGAGPGDFTSQELTDRFNQFYAENYEIVPAAGDALAAGDLATFGRLVDRSQVLTTDVLRNQVPETVHLARSARSLGAAAASAFGAGFGGSVWALVRSVESADFVSQWAGDYRAHFPEASQRADIFCTAAGPGAFAL
jgi:galactokinase